MTGSLSLVIQRQHLTPSYDLSNSNNFYQPSELNLLTTQMDVGILDGLHDQIAPEVGPYESDSPRFGFSMDGFVGTHLTEAGQANFSESSSSTAPFPRGSVSVTARVESVRPLTQCPICERNLTSSRYLTFHYRSWSSMCYKQRDKIYGCPVGCGLFFKDEEGMKGHVRSEGLKCNGEELATKDERGKWICQVFISGGLCNLSYTRVGDLNKHQQSDHHIRRRVWKCSAEGCEFSDLEHSEFIEHRRNVHGKSICVAEGKGGKPCNKEFMRAADLRRHMGTVHDPNARIWECQEDGCRKGDRIIIKSKYWKELGYSWTKLYRDSNRAFTRRDKYREHRRVAHNLD